MRQIPKAIRHQSFSDGVLEVFNAVDVAPAGSPPKLELKKVPGIVVLRYEQRSVSQKREADGRRDNINVAKVLRVQFHRALRSDMVVIDKDGEQYDVKIVQEITATQPWSMDLTLQRKSPWLPREVDHDV